jgi:DNA-binding NarL/FixJ family response regulator
MRILMIDDHALVREGMARVIESLQPEATIWATGSYGEAMQVVEREVVDLVLLDLMLPDRSGVDALRALRASHPELPVVIVSAAGDAQTVLQVLDLGARAFVSKSSDTSVLRDAISAVLAGQIYLPESVVPRAGADAPAPAAPPIVLSERQQQVLALLAAGLPNKLIARRLDIAESTVKVHITGLMRQLRVTSRTQALIAAAKAGLRLPFP